MAERENLPPGLRFKILVRDNFRCVYCGKTKDEERIDVDHVIPVASGGTNDPGNLVAACWTCNIGKSKSHVIPVAAEDEGVYVRKKSPGFGAVPAKAARDPNAGNPLPVWVPKFQERWPVVDVTPEGIDVNFKADNYHSSCVFFPSMICRGRDNSDIGSYVRVLVVPWKALGCFNLEEQEQIRNAVISGYSVPTIILMGTPSLFFGVVIYERHKGTPRGRIVDQHLEPLGDWSNNKWYPDEDLTFEDLREPYRNKPSECHVIDFDDDAGVITGIYASYDGMGVWNGF
jgi:hypothetical protein